MCSRQNGQLCPSLLLGSDGVFALECTIHPGSYSVPFGAGPGVGAAAGLLGDYGPGKICVAQVVGAGGGT